MSSGPQRTLIAAAAAISVGLAAVVVMRGGFSPSGPLRLLELLAVIVVGAGFLLGLMAIIGVRLAGWEAPESEEEFDRVVEEAERIAAEGTAAEPDEVDFMDLDPYSDEDFEELVRDALDDLPDLLRNLIENHNVAVTISDKGRRHNAYGLYRGDGATRDNVADQIIVFRDTLRRDFGHDPDTLREQVTITVRHELAHHVGFDELGVRDLGL
ncbi:MAG: metallopeptidase family protein [Baekduia sp.]